MNKLTNKYAVCGLILWVAASIGLAADGGIQTSKKPNILVILADDLGYGDVATQIDMMISPQLWRETIKPRLARVIAAAKAANPEILIFYHGDGNMARIIPELIEIGVEILNPVQPECMDPFEMKRLYGDRLAFWGCVGTQTTLPFGTPESIHAICRELIERVGAGGGLLLAPTHTIEPDVPWENIVAFVDAVRDQSAPA